MIPIRDTIPAVTFPYVTIMLILINVGVFILQLLFLSEPDDLYNRAAVIPAKYFWYEQYRPEQYGERFAPLITSMFLHGGWMHILGNMWFLWIFGDNVEDRMGHFRYLIFYLVCGIGAGLSHIYLYPDSQIPTIGASGAIAGVMGAYFISFPQSRVLTLIPVIIFFPLIEVPAVFFLGFWFVIQFLQGTVALASPDVSGGVAWWAHLGGFVAGAVLVFFFRKRKTIYRRQWGENYLDF